MFQLLCRHRLLRGLRSGLRVLIGRSILRTGLSLVLTRILTRILARICVLRLRILLGLLRILLRVLGLRIRLSTGLRRVAVGRRFCLWVGRVVGRLLHLLRACILRRGTRRVEQNAGKCGNQQR